MKRIPKSIIYSFYLIIFFILIVVSYNSSRRKPDSVTELISDPKWLNNWPKWLDAPFKDWINTGWKSFIADYGLIFDAIGYGLLRGYTTLKTVIVQAPWPLVVVGVIAITYFTSGRKLGTTVFVGFCTFFIGFLNPRFWDKAIETTTMVVLGIFLCIIIGIPVGIAMARSERVRNAILPVLDLMQVIPAFCYLIPGIILFGLGAIPAIISIIVYAAPPLIRLTDLGIRLVDKEIIEAAESFGANKKQKLWGVQMPLALPNIMQGINQCTMMALAMVVIASMIGTRGLGDEVLLGLQQLNVGAALEAGLAIVLLAIVLDRMTQAYGDKIQERTQPQKKEKINMSKIEVKNVFKIFGTNPDSVLPMVKEGASKEEVLEKTGHTVGLDNVSLSIEEGETFVCMGLSGSGKSTLIRHLNRLIDPTDGDIIVDGTNVMELSDQQLIEFRKHEMSMVFQRFGLFPHKTVLENVGYGLEIQGKEVEERKKLAMAQIESVGLQGFEDQYPSQLSGGMQQRVGLARALATNPQILLMDEAFSALDPLIRSDMQSQLIELQAKLKKTIVFITHDLDESLRLGDHIGILNGGRLVQAGTPEEIIMNPADDYVEAFVKDVNRAKVLRAKTVMVKANEFNSKDLKLSDVYKVDEGSYIEQFLPKVLADRCTIQVVDKMGDIKGYITEKELAVSLSKDAHNIR